MIRKAIKGPLVRYAPREIETIIREHIKKGDKFDSHGSALADLFECIGESHKNKWGSIGMETFLRFLLNKRTGDYLTLLKSGYVTLLWQEIEELSLMRLVRKTGSHENGDQAYEATDELIRWCLRNYPPPPHR